MEDMEKEKNYNIGLDIGVGSVGWCVTDEENNILKKGSKNMWGSDIFEEAQTAKTRRNFRSSKRRLERRKERVNMLQSLMLEDMEAEYPNFFPMLKETTNVKEDKTISDTILGVKYNLFSDIGLTDKDYFKKYPTVYHLRKELVENPEKKDIRLVYLALHHIIKYRGNFLHDNNFSNNTNEVGGNLQTIIEYLKENDIETNKNVKDIIDILSNKKISKANKKDLLMQCFEYTKDEKPLVSNVFQAILGYSFDINKIFDVNIEKSKISFSQDIENEDEIKNALNEHIEIYEALNTTYSWYILQDILKGNQYISEAFIEKYEKYKEDLRLLKDIYKKYYKDEYKDMFRKEHENNYVAYNGKNSGKTCKKCDPDKFLNQIKNKIEQLPDTCEQKQSILQDLKDNNFLSKINIRDNGEIPHQLHEIELEKILENQSKYYKTLEQNKDKILKLFSFRIPYYAGPLAKSDKQSEWAWMVRKKDEKIRPWNFEEVVNVDETAEEFIKRMTNKCTYILNEDVIPKQSILYSKFCVLNELNNIRINEKTISKDMKKLIIEELFKKKKKVTKNMLINLFKIEGFTVESITGLSDGETFNSNMASYIDMKEILGKVDESNIEQCKKIIYWITVFEDKEILRRKIKTTYKELTDNQIDALAKRRYKGWSRLSERLLIGLKSYDNNESIMEKLENTTLNFMQIINKESFRFKEQLENLMPKKEGKIEYKDISEIPTSPANKRAIWQTVCVVNEISKIMKKEPKNIYIEFARSEEDQKQMKSKRIDKLLKIYENFEKQVKDLKDYDPKVYKELKQRQSDKELTDKMYLYFIQNGKCMYSGKPLNLDEINKYEIDHIVPRSYQFIDGFDNKALVIREENQRKGDNLLLSDEIINNRQGWWKSLLDNGLITQTKYFRLIKRKQFETNEDRERFIERQLVETRQITKYVTNLLKSQYNSNIFTIRADLTHQFREKYKLYKNRNVNNYHHAHDAYILNCIGNILDKEWHGLESFKYNEYAKKYIKDYLNEEKSKKEKYGIILGFINKRIDVEKVKKTLNYKDCFIRRMPIEETGKFYDQTLYSPKEKPIIPLKQNKSADKYGGYTNENKAYYVICSYKNKKGKTEYKLIGIPIQISYMIKNNKTTQEEYIKNNFLQEGCTDFKIIKNKILKNQEFLDENNEKMRFCSDTEIRVSQELVVNEEINELIYLMNKGNKNLDDNQLEKLEKGYNTMFQYLLEKLKKQYKIFETTYKKLLDKQSEFEELKDEDKKDVINGLIDLMQTGQGNLKAIGLGERVGRRGGQKFKTDRLLKMTFIEKSVTGMYERRFKINGMENSCSK